MLQRIQTVLLLLASLFILLAFVYPMANFLSEMHYYKMYMCRVVPGGQDAQNIFSQGLLIPLAITALATSLIGFLAIFMYRNRRKQQLMVRLAILLNVILLGLIFLVYSPMVSKATGAQADYIHEIGIWFPIISLISLFFAGRRIRHDERLVRSADRLR